MSLLTNQHSRNTAEIQQIRKKSYCSQLLERILRSVEKRGLSCILFMLFMYNYSDSRDNFQMLSTDSVKKKGRHKNCILNDILRCRLESRDFGIFCRWPLKLVVIFRKLAKPKSLLPICTSTPRTFQLYFKCKAWGWRSPLDNEGLKWIVEGYSPSRQPARNFSDSPPMENSLSSTLPLLDGLFTVNIHVYWIFVNPRDFKWNWVFTQ